MNKTLFLLLILTLGCSSNHEVKTNMQFETKTPQAKTLTRTSVPVGNWKLVQINRSWEQVPLFPKNEIWKIDDEGNIAIFEADSFQEQIQCSFKMDKSGFSNDTVWIIQGNFKSFSSQNRLEIKRKHNHLVLIEQCDDCRSFEFEKI